MNASGTQLNEINPADLGQYGKAIVFDPQDLRTLFQDAAGTTPVTGVEQPVGLMLDMGQGLELGPELVTNGAFDTNTDGWAGASSAEVAFSGGRVEVDIANAFNSGITSDSNVIVVAGSQYEVTADIEIGTFNGSSVIFRLLGISSGAIQIAPTGVTRCKAVITSSNSTTAQVMVQRGTPNVYGTLLIDNISVRELKGYHAAQPTAASRPTLSARYNMLVGTDTLATQSVTTLATDYTLSFSGTGTVTLGTTATGTYSAGVSIFTATAGTLTLTVAGNVTNAMLVSTNQSHPQGLTYGPELVTNGDFSNGTTGWQNNYLSYSATGGKLLLTSDAAGSGSATQTISSVSPGGQFLFSGTAKRLDANSASARVAVYENSMVSGLIGNAAVSTTSEVSGSLLFKSSVDGDFQIACLLLSATGAGAQAEFDNISVREITNLNDVRLPYQSVTSSTVYDSDPSKFPWYLRFTDHWMVTPSIDATAYDKVMVACGLRKMSDAGPGSIIESSTSASTTTGAFYLAAPSTTDGNNARMLVNPDGGSSRSAFVTENITAPKTTTLLGVASIGENAIKLCANGACFSNDGTLGGVFGDHPIYIGKRNGTIAPFNGYLYGATILFPTALPNDNLIAALERHYAAKAGIVI